MSDPSRRSLNIMSLNRRMIDALGMQGRGVISITMTFSRNIPLVSVTFVPTEAQAASLVEIVQDYTLVALEE